MDAKQVAFKKIMQFSDATLYHASFDGVTIPFEVETTKDRIGTLYTIECSICGRFQEYGMKKVKERISNLFEYE